MTRKIDALLSEYGESHQNKTNKAVHWICVPVIFWCVMCLLFEIPAPSLLGNWGWLGISALLALGYYFILSWKLAIGFALVLLVGMILIGIYEGATDYPLWRFALGLFVLAWLGQFWGHKVEGKKPSFFKDIQFLMIGPAWLMSFIYTKIGIKY